MNQKAKITIDGNVGTGVAENMMSGRVHVKGNASQSAGATAHGGLLIIEACCDSINLQTTEEEINKTIEDSSLSDVTWIASHPIAGTEYSGPQSGFAELFEKRWDKKSPHHQPSTEQSSERRIRGHKKSLS